MGRREKILRKNEFVGMQTFEYSKTNKLIRNKLRNLNGKTFDKCVTNANAVHLSTVA